MRLLRPLSNSSLTDWWNYMTDHIIDADGGFCNVCRTAVVRINHEWRHEHETDSAQPRQQETTSVDE